MDHIYFNSVHVGIFQLHSKISNMHLEMKLLVKNPCN